MLESVAAECSVAHSLQLLQALSAVNATEQLVPHIVCGPLVVAKLLVVLACSMVDIVAVDVQITAVVLY